MDSIFQDIIKILWDKVPKAFEQEPQWLHRELKEKIDVLYNPEEQGDIGPLSSDAEPLLYPDGLEEELPPIDERLRGEVQKAGIESLAWYQSFHWAPDNWGIYIKEDGCYFLAREVIVGSEPLDPLYRILTVFRLLHSHEYFHFLTDVVSTFLELQLTTPIYVEHVERHQAKTRWAWNHLEEALANAFTFRKRWPQGVKGKISNFMVNQPAGYCDFPKYLNLENFKQGQRELCWQLLPKGKGYIFLGSKVESPKILLSQFGPPGMQELPLSELLFDTENSSVNIWDVPIYIVRSKLPGVPRLRFITKIPKLVESDKFKKDLKTVPQEMQKRYNSS